MLAVFFSPVLGVSNIGDTILFKVINENDFNNRNVRSLDPALDDTFNKEQTSQATTNNVGQFLDATAKVFSWFITIITVGFALFSMLAALQAPFLITALVGIPIGVAFYVSIVSAIRGFNA